MTEPAAPDNLFPPSPAPEPPPLQLRPASFFKLSLSRPLLPLRASRLLAWLAFFFLALVPLVLTVSVVWYLRSARWPADFSRDLSRRVGLPVSVDSLSLSGAQSRALRGLRIYSSDPSHPLLLAGQAESDSPGSPRLFLKDVRLFIDLDWWADPKAAPDPASFPRADSFPAFVLQGLTLELHRGSTDLQLPAENGLLQASGPLLQGQVVSSSPQLHSLSGELGYRQGRLVKQLKFRRVSGDLLRLYLARALGESWVASFLSPVGDLSVGDLSGGNNWMLTARTLVDPSRLGRVTGLAGFTGTFDLALKDVGGLDSDVMQGEFVVRLAADSGSCPADSLKSLQYLITGVEPRIPLGIDRFDFDFAGLSITLSKERIYIHALGDNDAAISNHGMPVLKFKPQQVPRDEFLRRLAVLRASGPELNVTSLP